MSKRCYSEITEDNPRLFVFLQPYPRAKARWNRAKKVFLAGKAKDNTNRKKKAIIQPYLSKGGVKAKDKIPKRRRVVPELREVGYRDTAAKVWQERVSKVVRASCDYRKHSDFPMHSRKITKKSHGNLPLIRRKKRHLDITIRKFVQEYLRSHFLHDDLKASNQNPAVPASYAPSALNSYYSLPVDNYQGNKPGYTRVWSYGSGSGSSTIGLDPRTHKIFRATDKSKAGYWASRVLKEIEEMSRVDPDLHQQLGDDHFNVISMKVYWGDKEVNRHNDISMTKYSGPQSNNSQKPGTPVIIYTVGDPKKLVFHRHELEPCTQHSGYEFVQTSCEHDITIGQLHGDSFALVYEDELHDGGYYLSHSSNAEGLVPDCETYYKGITISIMTRCCVHQAWISDEDDTVFCEKQETRAHDENVFFTHLASTVIDSAQHRCVWAALKHNAGTMFYDYYRIHLWGTDIAAWDDPDWNADMDKSYPSKEIVQSTKLARKKARQKQQRQKQQQHRKKGRTLRIK